MDKKGPAGLRLYSLLLCIPALTSQAQIRVRPAQVTAPQTITTTQAGSPQPGVRPTLARPTPGPSVATVALPIDTAFRRMPLPYLLYLSAVGQRNFTYATQQFNVDLAQAAIAQARIFPDPSLGAGYFNNGQRRLQTGYGFLLQVNQTLELGGKRRARINLAQSQSELARMTLLDFFRLLRADATLGFLEGIRRQRAFQIQRDNYRYLTQLAEVNQRRYQGLAIPEVDAVQSRVEAESAFNNLIQAAADWKTSLVALGLFQGGLPLDTLYQPVGDLTRFDRSFILADLISQAQNMRADLLVTRQGQDVARNALRLALANRMIDLNLSLTTNFVSPITNIIEPTPSYNVLSVGVTIPLKFSNRYNNETRVARLQGQQADLAYRQVELQIQVEVTQAYEQYRATQQRVQQFTDDLLVQAQRVLESRIYAYNRGSSTLLEVLIARQTFNQLQINYNDALMNYASALVNLERASGIWDIDF